jgi:hypothetical protein
VVPDECKRSRPDRVRSLCLTALVTVLMSCHHEETPRARFVPLADIASRYGELVAVANHPTPDQYGTGERIGLFRAADGTIWGLPITLGDAGEILVCAPPELSGAAVTDRLPAGTTTILGATNEPTGWRGGTGRLEIVIRDANGLARWQAVRSGETPGQSACWAPELVDGRTQPQHRLQYYRLEPDR